MFKIVTSKGNMLCQKILQVGGFNSRKSSNNQRSVAGVEQLKGNRKYVEHTYYVMELIEKSR